MLDCVYRASVGLGGTEAAESVTETMPGSADYSLEALVILRTAERIYAVNGRTQDRATHYGWEPLLDSPVWLEYADILGVKVSIGPVLRQGVKLCFNQSSQ